MKRFISIAAILAASAAVALAQPPSGTVKKQSQAAQVIKTTTTTTYDTMALASSPTAVVAANDSLINARFGQIQEQIQELKDDTRNIVRGEVRKLQSDRGRTGNFVVRTLQSSIPLMPFILGAFIAFFWFRYSYKRRVIRQEMIYKYIDRGEQVPEWLTRGETLSEPTTSPNGAVVPSTKNAKLFLVLAIIAAAITLIWFIALTSSYRWLEVFNALLGCCAFGFATVYCFRQYIKRTE